MVETPGGALASISFGEFLWRKQRWSAEGAQGTGHGGVGGRCGWQVWTAEVRTGRGRGRSRRRRLSRNRGQPAGGRAGRIVGAGFGWLVWWLVVVVVWF